MCYLLVVTEFEGRNLLAHPISVMVAGFEATTDALSFCLYELARHPEHQVTLYDEIQTYISNKELTLDLINEMPFLDSLVIEILRLYPPLPMTDRIATRDYKVTNEILSQTDHYRPLLLQLCCECFLFSDREHWIDN